MKIALAQLNYSIGDIDGNARRIIDAIHKAEAEGADLVLFAEYDKDPLLLADVIVLLFYSIAKTLSRIVLSVLAVKRFYTKEKRIHIKQIRLVCY